MKLVNKTKASKSTPAELYEEKMVDLNKVNMNYKKYFNKYAKSKKPVTIPKGPKMLNRKKRTTIA